MDHSDDEKDKDRIKDSNADDKQDSAALKKLVDAKEFDYAAMEQWLSQQWQQLYGQSDHGPMAAWYLRRRANMMNIEILNTSLLAFLLFDLEKSPPLPSTMLIREALEPEAHKPFFNNDATWVSKSLKAQSLVDRSLFPLGINITNWHRGAAYFCALPQRWQLSMVGKCGHFSMGATVRDFQGKDLAHIKEIQHCFINFIELQRWLEDHGFSYHLDYGSLFTGEITMADVVIQLQPVGAKNAAVYGREAKPCEVSAKIDIVLIPVRGWDSASFRELRSKLVAVRRGRIGQRE